MYLIAQTRVLGGGALLSCCSHHAREHREGNGTSRANHWALSSSGRNLDGATGWCYVLLRVGLFNATCHWRRLSLCKLEFCIIVKSLVEATVLFT